MSRCWSPVTTSPLSLGFNLNLPLSLLPFTSSLASSTLPALPSFPSLRGLASEPRLPLPLISPPLPSPSSRFGSSSPPPSLSHRWTGTVTSMRTRKKATPIST